ncbi:hypothetical protein GCM10027610_077500 [Dactylosporangium cerinum]
MPDSGPYGGRYNELHKPLDCRKTPGQRHMAGPCKVFLIRQQTIYGEGRPMAPFAKKPKWD